jgi:preprotein translocase subunit SecB
MSHEIEPLKPYPIQATYIGVRELYIKANVAPSEKIQLEDTEPILSLGHSTYDETRKTIGIAVKLEMGNEKEPSPFHLRIQLVGEFKVDEMRFPAERVIEWAKTNALFIFHPFLREHVFALTARCGFFPLMLQLVEVPTFAVQR